MLAHIKQSVAKVEVIDCECECDVVTRWSLSAPQQPRLTHTSKMQNQNEFLGRAEDFADQVSS